VYFSRKLDLQHSNSFFSAPTTINTFSGTVTEWEFIAEFKKVEKAAAKAEAYQKTFDANKDGKVTPEEIKAVITEADTDKSGTISAGELQDLIVGTPEINKDEAAKEAAATTLLDTNNNKKVEEKEVTDFVAKTDTDKSNTLSEKEIAASIEKPGTLAEDAAEKTLIDSNKNNKIEAIEIHAFFVLIDLNGDKQLSVDELKKFFM